MSARSIPQSRYECKYLIDAHSLSDVRRFIRPFMKVDANAASAGGCYTITSLYLDAPDLSLLRMGQQGLSERFKLRARTYSDLSSEPVWLEIKRRHSGVVHKLRSRVTRPAARAWLERQVVAPSGASQDRNLAAFRQAVLTCDAQPVALVRYQREAYESRGSGGVRVTFDTHVECAHEPQASFTAPPACWRPVGIEGVVLEIKFTGTYPPWVQALLGRFELERRSISKYTHSMETLGPLVRARSRVELGA